MVYFLGARGKNEGKLFWGENLSMGFQGDKLFSVQVSHQISVDTAGKYTL